MPLVKGVNVGTGGFYSEGNCNAQAYYPGNAGYFALTVQIVSGRYGSFGIIKAYSSITRPE